ncbi:hypothetical protein FHX28_001566 [Clostridium beijerinckii]|nr:hypothetical protein [Clostridium beijerinckii]
MKTPSALSKELRSTESLVFMPFCRTATSGSNS